MGLCEIETLCKRCALIADEQADLFSSLLDYRKLHAFANDAC